MSEDEGRPHGAPATNLNHLDTTIPRCDVGIAELLGIAVEGAVDRFCGRPRNQNPYSLTTAREWFEAWDAGWADADHLLRIRGAEEAARWLRAV